jgi:competence protein ComGF
MKGTVWEHPQQHTRIQYGNSITITAEIDNKIYKLQSPQLLDPGDYPAIIDKGTVRLQVKDKKDKEKTIKLRVVSVAAKQ